MKSNRALSVVKDVHADDYGLTAHATNDILACLQAGKLNSISVLTNMSCFEEFVEKYHEEKKNWVKPPLLTIHLNFMEGRSMADCKEVTHLIHENGYFKIGWGNLFLWNYSPWMYRQIKAELKAEIKAQTQRFRKYFGQDYGSTIPLRFDGHQHTQMIPIVYHALIEVIKEEGYLVDYIRVTKEPILPFIKEVSLWKTYVPINIVKNLLLNFYSLGMERKLNKQNIKMHPMYLWGVMFSGHMDKNRVGKLLPLMEAQAKKKGRKLEVLFHPGTTVPNEIGEEFSNKGNLIFYLSEGRHTEYEALMFLQFDDLQS